jgi:hypothetical protein
MGATNDPGNKLRGAVKLRDVYIKVAREVTGPRSIDFQREACPDQFVGSIEDFDGNSDDFPLRKPVIRLDDHPCVVLVMESPHKDEFIGDRGPAKGKTGVQIRKYIATIVAGLGGQASELILVNAIQYQCSLGVATHNYRDEVFCRLWKKGGEADFEGRLTQTYRFGDMLFNCCTGSERRKMITAAIRNLVGSVPLFSGPHPFSWRYKQNRMSVKLDTAHQIAGPYAASLRG